MNKEPIIQDKIHLLMEETGCDQGEAELAMNLADYDLEKAIRTIGTLLRHIVVVKSKFQLPSKNLYGLILLIADTKRRKTFRIRSIVSCNPALYETDLAGDWYDFEKNLYAFRLWEGTLQQVTQELERVLCDYLDQGKDSSLYEILEKEDETPLDNRFREVIKGYFSDDSLETSSRREELNLDQFRRYRPDGKEEIPVEKAPEAPHKFEPVERLLLNVNLQQDSGGIPAQDVRVGDSVYVLLTDERDVAQYLSRLLGGRSETSIKPLVAPVEEIKNNGGKISLQVRLASGIMGIAEVNDNSLLRMQKPQQRSWWRRLIPFS